MDLDLQSNQPDHRRAEGKWGGEVGAEVEQRQPVRHAGGADHAHHLTTHEEELHKTTQHRRRQQREGRVLVPGSHRR